MAGTLSERWTTYRARRRDARDAKPKRGEPAATLVFLLKLAIVVWVLRSFIFAPFSIPSESMLPRLLIGDYLFISKMNYGYSRWSFPWGFPPVAGRLGWSQPERGDVVVFRGPDPAPGDTDPEHADHDVIKRVIGLPGDTIEMRHGQVILNGQPVPKVKVADFVLPLSPNFDELHCGGRFQSTDDGKPVCRYPQFRETLPNGVSYNVLDQGEFADRDDTSLYTVPAGHVFVMGDNRDNSADSRFAAPKDALPGQGTGMGYVPLDRVEGKAVLSFWSTDGSAKWLLPWTWFSAARWNRMGHGF